MDAPAALTDPSSVLVGLAAICGLFAAAYWARVARSGAASGEMGARPADRNLSTAAALTAFCLGLASAGYLLGRFTGRF